MFFLYAYNDPLCRSSQGPIVTGKLQSTKKEKSWILTNSTILLCHIYFTFFHGQLFKLFVPNLLVRAFEVTDNPAFLVWRVPLDFHWIRRTIWCLMMWMSWVLSHTVLQLKDPFEKRCFLLVWYLGFFHSLFEIAS